MVAVIEDKKGEAVPDLVDGDGKCEPELPNEPISPEPDLEILVIEPPMLPLSTQQPKQLQLESLLLPTEVMDDKPDRIGAGNECSIIMPRPPGSEPDEPNIGQECVIV